MTPFQRPLRIVLLEGPRSRMCLTYWDSLRNSPNMSTSLTRLSVLYRGNASEKYLWPFRLRRSFNCSVKSSLRTPFRFCIKVCYCDRGYKSIMPEVPFTLPFEYIKTPAAPLALPSGTSSGERTTTPLHCGDGTETGSETGTKWKLNMGRDGTGSGSIFWRIRPSSLARVALAVSRLFSARI